jgi:hypothetical protein
VFIAETVTHGTVSVTENGASRTTAEAGVTITLTVVPETGYRLKAGSLQVNGGPVAVGSSGNRYTFTMPEGDVTVTAQFELVPVYPITLGSPQNGSVKAEPASGVAGTEITLRVNPNEGYTLTAGSLTVNSGAVPVTGSGNTYTFTMPEGDVTVTAQFEALPPGTYSVTIGTLQNGEISTDKTSAGSGETVTLTVEPGSGYRLKADSLQVNGGEIRVTASGDAYSFTMPSWNVTVTAQFEELPPNIYAVTITLPQYGSVQAEPLSGAAGTLITLRVSANEGYILTAGSLKVNDGAVTVSGSGPYTFTMPAGNVTVTAQFEAVTSNNGNNQGSGDNEPALPLTETVYFGQTGNGKTTVDQYWNGWDDEGADQAVKLQTGEELTAYFVVNKSAAQTITVGAGYTDQVQVITDRNTDGTTPDSETVVAAVNTEDLLFDGTDETGKGVQTFTLVVSEPGKTPVTVTVNLELTLPQEATIYKKVNGQWEKQDAELTQDLINKNYTYNKQGTADDRKMRGHLALTAGPVRDLQNAIAWVDAYAESGTGTALVPGTTNGYSQYRILIKKDEKIGRVALRFNTADYVSLELYGAGLPDSPQKNMERRISLNHSFNTLDHLLNWSTNIVQMGFITVFHNRNTNYKILVLGKNITIDGENYELTVNNPTAIDNILGFQSLLYAGKKGAIIMRPHSKITGHFTKRGFTPVNLNYGYFYMQGGEISGNRVRETMGCVIYIDNWEGEPFVYTGGTVAGNTASDGSGGPINKVKNKQEAIVKDFDL